MPRIIVTFDKYGNSKVDAEGFVGDTCVQATQAIEQALAGDAKPRHLKPEYDDTAAASTENSITNQW